MMRPSRYFIRLSRRIITSLFLFTILSTFIINFEISHYIPTGFSSVNTTGVEKGEAAVRGEIETLLRYGAQIKNMSRTEGQVLERSGYDEVYYDTVPLIRAIADYRPQWCLKQTYNVKPTPISIVFHYLNEPVSLVLRTIYSILRVTPSQFLHEIIVLDDGSDINRYPELELIGKVISVLGPKVKYIRHDEPIGLVPARRKILQLAAGEVVFLIDSHVELGDDWWLPILNITQSNYRAVVAPVLDMNYNEDRTGVHRLDGVKVDFNMWFGWESGSGDAVYEEGEPFRSGCIMGGAYGITKRWLEEIDYSGRGLEGYGGEQIEVGIKTWRCGGEVWIVPCSRVLHHGAKRIPSEIGERSAPRDGSYNVRMLAEIHHDDFGKQLMKKRFGYKDDLDWVSVNHTKALMKELQCRPLMWVFDNVMPSLGTFREEYLIGYKLISVEQPDNCLELDHASLNLVFRQCSPWNDPWDLVRMSKAGYIRVETKQCLDGGYMPPKFGDCHFGEVQRFSYDKVAQQLVYDEGRCLVVNSEGVGVIVGCEETLSRWTFGMYFDNPTL